MRVQRPGVAGFIQMAIILVDMILPGLMALPVAMHGNLQQSYPWSRCDPWPLQSLQLSGCCQEARPRCLLYLGQRFFPSLLSPLIWKHLFSILGKHLVSIFQLFPRNLVFALKSSSHKSCKALQASVFLPCTCLSQGKGHRADCTSLITVEKKGKHHRTKIG